MSRETPSQTHAAPDPQQIEQLWKATLADRAHALGGSALAPDATYKSTLDDGGLPSTVRDATLSGVGTLGGSLSGRATLGAAAASPAGARATLGEFELLEEIGRGGMGVVFRARQRSLARDIAIKLIRPEAQAESARGQFVAEALVNGLLDHPNIVPVHELGANAQGETFLAMKLVGGTSWKHLLHPTNDAQRRLAAEYDLERHLGVLQSVANAVAYAHSKGIVHRDLKPENVMVGAFGEVLVMDWGIAVDVRERPGADARARHKSSIHTPAGTPCYMPPELAEGRGADIGPWTDTYLLGAILHELVTGHPPHRGDTLLAVLLAAAASTPPSFPAGTPAALAAICTKALSRRREERYANVAEFQAALRDFLRHRDSQKVSAAASQALQRARESVAGNETARVRRYAEFSEAIAGFRQALVLWSENQEARDGERSARLAFAVVALESGDVVLAQAQLEHLEATDRDALSVRERIAAVETARAKARSMARTMRRALVGGTVVVVAGLVAGLVVLTRAQLHNAGAIAKIESERKDIAAQVARQSLERRVRAALHGEPEIEARLVAEGTLANGAALSAKLVEDLGLEPDVERLLAWSPESARALGVTANGRKACVASAGGATRRYELDAAGAATCGAFSADGRVVAVANDSGTAELWKLEEFEAAYVNSIALGGAAECLALDPRAATLASSMGAEVKLWSVANAVQQGSTIVAPRPVVRLQLDDDVLWIVARDGAATDVWRCDARTGNVERRTTIAPPL